MVLCLGGWVNWLKVLFQTEGGQSLLLPSFSSSNSSYSSRPLPRSSPSPSTSCLSTFLDGRRVGGYYSV